MKKLFLQTYGWPLGSLLHWFAGFPAESRLLAWRCRLAFLVWLFAWPLFSPKSWAEDWQVVWKDDMQRLSVDRDSVRVDGAQIEYRYRDEVDAIVDRMEHHYRVVSDCVANRMRWLEIYDPDSGRTSAVKDAGWKDMSHDPDDPVTVMHYEVCRDFGS